MDQPVIDATRMTEAVSGNQLIRTD